MTQYRNFNVLQFMLMVIFYFILLQTNHSLANGNIKYTDGLISYIDLSKGELILLRKLYTFKSTVKVIIDDQIFPTVRDLTTRVNIHIRYTVIKGENRISKIEVIPI